MDKNDILRMIDEREHLAHYGIKGQKHGVRRWQNEDGSLTPEGYRHYGINQNKPNISEAISKVNDKTTTDYSPFNKKEIKNDSEENALANRYFKKAEKFEPQITKDVVDSIKNIGSTMYGLDNRLKQPESLSRKILSDSVNKGIDKEKAANDISDIIRYTMISDEDKLVDDYKKLKDLLEEKGYEEQQLKNYYKRFYDNKVSHKALQSVYKDKNGVSFEIQYHTPSSQAVKELKLPLYNEARQLKTSDTDRKEEIENEMRELAKKINDPKDILSIIEYDKLKHLDNDSDYLAHYGIKGQEWGVRRFQNEDGSLTPEGRRRYGLKSDYSNMTDQQLRDAITTKRTQNQYVDIMTKDARKKRQDISNFVRTASSTAGSVVNLADKTILEKQRNDFDERIEKYKNHNKALAQQKIDVKKDNPKADFSKVDATIKENNEKIDYYKNAKKNIDIVKNLTSQAVSSPGSHADSIGKLATSSELEEQTQLAYRNIQEMDKDDLKKVVDRMMLEKQYDELINPPQPSKWERGREIVQSIGAGIGILTGVATLALTIKKLSAKHSDLDDGSEFLAHYGVKGMRKGVRRWTNEDGTLTPEGYRHYGIDPRGRQASPQDILARQRAREKAQKMELRSQVRQNAYTQKIAQRQAMREARNQARIQNIYDRQNLAIQKQAREQELQAKAENRENIRKNVVKGAIAIAAIAGAVMIGRHVLKERSLNAMHVRDMERETLLGKQRIDELKESNRLGILKEENRMKELKLNERVATPDIKTPNPSKVNNPINNGTGMFKGQANERRDSREQKDFEKGLKDALNYQEQGRQANERQRLDSERYIRRESREQRIADRANALSERRERQAQDSLLRTQRQSEIRAHNERQRELERVFKNDAREQKAKKNLIKGFSTDWASSETKVRDIPNNTSNSVKPFVESITREKRYDSTKLNRMYAARGTNAAKKVFEKLVYRTSGRIRHEEEELYVTS